jgi:hypothetical protein
MPCETNNWWYVNGVEGYIPLFANGSLPAQQAIDPVRNASRDHGNLRFLHWLKQWLLQV